MKSSIQAANFIKKFEGFRHKAYKDIAGKLTIGYGHLIKHQELAVYQNAVLSEGEAHELLIKDIKSWESYLNRLCKQYEAQFNQNQFDALISFCFNLGNFTNDMLMRLKNKDKAAIGKAISLYNIAGDRVSLGLTARRKAEQNLYFKKC